MSLQGVMSALGNKAKLNDLIFFSINLYVIELLEASWSTRIGIVIKL